MFHGREKKELMKANQVAKGRMVSSSVNVTRICPTTVQKDNMGFCKQREVYIKT